PLHRPPRRDRRSRPRRAGDRRRPARKGAEEGRVTFASPSPDGEGGVGGAAVRGTAGTRNRLRSSRRRRWWRGDPQLSARFSPLPLIRSPVTPPPASLVPLPATFGRREAEARPTKSHSLHSHPRSCPS